jgi:hypothetical protein
MHVGSALESANRKSIGQVVIPVPAGRLRATGDRHGPQRQSARLCHHNGALCDRGSRVRAIDRRLRPTFHRRHLRWTWPAVAGHTFCGRPSGEMKCIAALLAHAAPTRMSISSRTTVFFLSVSVRSSTSYQPRKKPRRFRRSAFKVSSRPRRSLIPPRLVRCPNRATIKR